MLVELLNPKLWLALFVCVLDPVSTGFGAGLRMQREEPTSVAGRVGQVHPDELKSDSR